MVAGPQQRTGHDWLTWARVLGQDSIGEGCDRL